MSRKLLCIAEAMRMEIDGQEILLIKMPIPAPKIKTKSEFGVLDQILKVNEQIPIVSVLEQSDGTLRVASPQEWIGKLRSKTILASDLKKLPIYEDDLE